MKYFYSLIASLFVPQIASAHVGYVVQHDQFVNNAGRDWNFLLDGIKEAPGVLVVGMIVVLCIVAGIVVLRRTKKYHKFYEDVKIKLASYHEMLGWICRLSIGIALVGAGTANVFISPVLAANPMISLLEIILGFFLLLGFMIVPTILVTMGVFLMGLNTSGYLFGNLDMLALTLALLFLDTKRPGLDDILNIGTHPKLIEFRKFVPLILRIGLGVAFIFLAVYEKLLNPHDSELVVTMYNLTRVVPVSPALWVFGTGVVELILGILLVIGFEVRIVAMVSFLVVSLSFFYFKEAVYSHVTLFGALSMLIVTGAGKYSLDFLRGKGK